MALAFILLPSLGDYGVVPSLAIITAGYGLTGRNTKMLQCLFDLHIMAEEKPAKLGGYYKRPNSKKKAAKYEYLRQGFT